ncbi:NAD(P)-binding domain-containing protein [Nocardia sp. NPDC051990]|uniref:NAD(P)-dependent oxidoreductase n=1 Tax=Nocardia sp. NPDC051990 TaxID=3155285 RepID=UPI00342F5A4D
MTRIGFIGVGDMGSRMAARLLSVGHQVTVFDIAPQRVADMVAVGAEAATTPAAAARDADLVISSVMSADIPTAHLAADGILAGLRPGAVLAVTSTTTPAILNSIASAMPPRTHLLDAALVGGVRYAAEGTLTVLLGGDEEPAAASEPILSSFGEVVRVGPLGSGVAYKLITNVVVMAAEAGLREALDLTDLLGGTYTTALDLLARGPMAAVVNRALDRGNPRPVRASAADFDVLIDAGGAENLPICAAARTRLWAAATAADSPMFYDLTTHLTALPRYRRPTVGTSTTS